MEVAVKGEDAGSRTTLTSLMSSTDTWCVGSGLQQEWWNDFLRYYYLMVQTVDGSLPRRFAFLVMILCLFTTLLVLLRRRRIPGIAVSPSWRLIGIVFGTIFFMMFNPTK
ncbi:arabinosyltransferase domain-containing protein, partial [Bacillus cereus]|uniref:arabinosyltransferase domain-containing protein n=1 Tax=Bacillus cereus TaxID=1396 RepID=UPI0035D624AB